MPEQLPRQASNRVRYSKEEMYISATVEDCGNYRVIRDRIGHIRIELNDPYLTEADFSVIALRQCVRCRTKNPNDSCALEHFVVSAQ